MNANEGDVSSAEHDRQLLLSYLSGERQAFMKFFRYHQPRLFNFSLGYMKNRALAEDVTQEVFLKFMSRMEHFDFKYAPSTLLFNIAINLCKDKLHSAYNRRISLIDDYDQECFLDNRAEQSLGFMKKEIDEAVIDCLQLLDHKYRIVYLLKRDAEMTFEEIARTTRISVRSAKRYLKKAAVEVLQYLNEQGFTLEDLS